MKRIQQRKYEQVTGYEYELKDITQDILYS